ETQTVKLTNVVGVSLKTVLRLLLAQVGGTYMIRPDYVEVTTTTKQAAEKVIRVYPVADLVIPIPNSVNQNSVNQSVNNSILGFQLDALRSLSFTGTGNLTTVGITGIAGIAGLTGLTGLSGVAITGLGGGGLAGVAGALGVGGLGGNIGGIAGL